MDAQMLTIVMGVVAFIGVVSLTAGLTHDKLVNSGEVTISSTTMNQPPSRCLLAYAVEHSRATRFLSPACGGGGTWRLQSSRS